MLKKIHTLLIIFGFSLITSLSLNLTPLKSVTNQLASHLPQPAVSLLIKTHLLSPQTGLIAKTDEYCSKLTIKKCRSHPECTVKTTHTSKTFTNQCTPDDCNHSGCNKKTIKIDTGRKICIGHSTKDCTKIYKYQTVCTGSYTTTVKIPHTSCVTNPNYHPPEPPSPKQPSTPKSNVTCRMSNGVKVKFGSKVYYRKDKNGKITCKQCDENGRWKDAGHCTVDELAYVPSFLRETPLDNPCIDHNIAYPGGTEHNGKICYNGHFLDKKTFQQKTNVEPTKDNLNQLKEEAAKQRHHRSCRNHDGSYTPDGESVYGPGGKIYKCQDSHWQFCENCDHPTIIPSFLAQNKDQAYCKLGNTVYPPGKLISNNNNDQICENGKWKKYQLDQKKVSNAIDQYQQCLDQAEMGANPSDCLASATTNLNQYEKEQFKQNIALIDFEQEISQLCLDQARQEEDLEINPDPTTVITQCVSNNLQLKLKNQDKDLVAQMIASNPTTIESNLLKTTMANYLVDHYFNLLNNLNQNLANQATNLPTDKYENFKKEINSLKQEIQQNSNLNQNAKTQLLAYLNKLNINLINTYSPLIPNPTTDKTSEQHPTPKTPEQLAAAREKCYTYTSPDLRQECLLRYQTSNDTTNQRAGAYVRKQNFTQDQQQKYHQLTQDLDTSREITFQFKRLSGLQKVLYSNPNTTSPSLTTQQSQINPQLSQENINKNLEEQSQLAKLITENLNKIQNNNLKNQIINTQTTEGQAVLNDLNQLANLTPNETSNTPPLSCLTSCTGTCIKLPLINNKTGQISYNWTCATPPKPNRNQNQRTNLHDLVDSPNGWAGVPDSDYLSGPKLEACGKINQPPCDSPPPCDQNLTINPKTHLCVLDTTKLALTTIGNNLANYYKDNHFNLQQSDQLAHILKTSLQVNKLDFAIQSPTTKQILSQAIKNKLNCPKNSELIYNNNNRHLSCISQDKLEKIAVNLYPDIAKGEKGYLDQKCAGLVFKYCQDDNLYCDSATHTCKLKENVKQAIANQIAIDYSPTNTPKLTALSSDLNTIDFNSLITNSQSNHQLASSLCTPTTKNQSYLFGGNCFACLDPNTKTIKELPLYACTPQGKTNLSTFLPGVQCRQSGGYCTTTVDKKDPYFKNLGTKDCPSNYICVKAKTADTIVGPYQKITSSVTQTCAKGLVPIDDTCLPPLVAAQNQHRTNGLAESAAKFTEHWGNNVPVVGHIVGGLITWAASAFHSISPTYHHDITIRTDSLQTQINRINSNPKINNQTKQQLVNQLLFQLNDQATVARLIARTKREKNLNVEASGNIIQRTLQHAANTIFNPGLYAYEVISAWTGEPPSSRGGASGSNAFLEYAQRNAELNTLESQGAKVGWERWKAAFKPGFQAATVIADLNGFGETASSITHAITRTATQQTLERESTSLLGRLISPLYKTEWRLPFTQKTIKGLGLERVDQAINGLISKTFSPLGKAYNLLPHRRTQKAFLQAQEEILARIEKGELHFSSQDELLQHIADRAYEIRHGTTLVQTHAPTDFILQNKQILTEITAQTYQQTLDTVHQQIAQLAREKIKVTDGEIIQTFLEDHPEAKIEVKPLEITKNGKTTKIYELHAPPSAPESVKQAIGKVNDFARSLENTLGFNLEEVQLERLTHPDEILTIQAGGGKTSVIAPLLAAKDGRTLYAAANNTEAESLLGDVWEHKDFYKEHDLKVIYLDEQGQWHQLDLNNTEKLATTTISPDQVHTYLTQAAKGEDKIFIISTRASLAWDNLRLNPLILQLKEGHFGHFNLVGDEIGADVLGQFSVSHGEPIKITKIKDPNLLGSGIKNGKQAIKIFEEVYNLETLSRDSLPPEKLVKYDNHFLPDDQTLTKLYQDIIEQTRNRFDGFFDKKHFASELTELDHIQALLKEGKLNEAKENFYRLLRDYPDSELIGDLRFRQSSLQAILDQRGKVPGVDFDLVGEGAEKHIALHRAGGYTGEQYSSIVKELALQKEGAAALGLEDSIPLSQLTISNHGDSMSLLSFYDEWLANGNHINGLDATSETPGHILNLKVAGEVEKPRLDLVKDVQFYEPNPENLASKIKAQIDPGKTTFIINADNSLSYAEVRQHLDLFDRNVFVAQHIKKPNGEDGVAFFKLFKDETGAIQTEHLSETEWNNLLSESVKNKPSKTAIIVDGRTRALDIKLTSNPKLASRLDVHLIAPRSGYEGVPTVLEEFIQATKRNRALVPRNLEKLTDPNAVHFHLYLSDDYQAIAKELGISSLANGTELNQEAFQTVLESLHRAKLAQSRFQATSIRLASAPENALRQLRELSVLAKFSETNIPSKDLSLLAEFAERQKANAADFKNLFLEEVVTEGKSGKDLYTTLYRQAERSFQQLNSYYSQLKELGLSPETLEVIGKKWGLLDANGQHLSLLDFDTFEQLLSQPTHNLTRSTDRSVNGILRNFAENNTIADADSLYRLADNLYVPNADTYQISPAKFVENLTKTQHPIITKFISPNKSPFFYFLSRQTLAGTTTFFAPLKAFWQTLAQPQYSPSYVNNYLKSQNILVTQDKLEQFVQQLPKKLSRKQIKQLALLTFSQPTNVAQFLDRPHLQPVNNQILTYHQLLDQGNILILTKKDGSVIQLTKSNLETQKPEEIKFSALESIEIKQPNTTTLFTINPEDLPQFTLDQLNQLAKSDLDLLLPAINALARTLSQQSISKIDSKAVVKAFSTKAKQTITTKQITPTEQSLNLDKINRQQLITNLAKHPWKLKIASKRLARGLIAEQLGLNKLSKMQKQQIDQWMVENGILGLAKTKIDIQKTQQKSTQSSNLFKKIIALAKQYWLFTSIVLGTILGFTLGSLLLNFIPFIPVSLFNIITKISKWTAITATILSILALIVLGGKNLLSQQSFSWPHLSRPQWTQNIHLPKVKAPTKLASNILKKSSKLFDIIAKHPIISLAIDIIISLLTVVFTPKFSTLLGNYISNRAQKFKSLLGVIGSIPLILVLSLLFSTYVSLHHFNHRPLFTPTTSTQLTLAPQEYQKVFFWRSKPQRLIIKPTLTQKLSSFVSRQVFVVGGIKTYIYYDKDKKTWFLKISSNLFSRKIIRKWKGLTLNYVDQTGPHQLDLSQEQNDLDLTNISQLQFTFKGKRFIFFNSSATLSLKLSVAPSTHQLTLSPTTISTPSPKTVTQTVQIPTSSSYYPLRVNDDTQLKFNYEVEYQDDHPTHLLSFYNPNSSPITISINDQEITIQPNSTFILNLETYPTQITFSTTTISINQAPTQTQTKPYQLKLEISSPAPQLFLPSNKEGLNNILQRYRQQLQRRNIFYPINPSQTKELLEFTQYLKNLQTKSDLVHPGITHIYNVRSLDIFKKPFIQLNDEELLVFAARTLYLNQLPVNQILSTFTEQISTYFSSLINSLHLAGTNPNRIKSMFTPESIGSQTMVSGLNRERAIGLHLTTLDINALDVERLEHTPPAYQLQVAIHELTHSIQDYLGAPPQNTTSPRNPTFEEAFTEWLTTEIITNHPHIAYTAGVLKIRNFLNHLKLTHPNLYDEAYAFFVKTALTSNFTTLDQWLAQHNLPSLTTIMGQTSDYDYYHKQAETAPQPLINKVATEIMLFIKRYPKLKFIYHPSIFQPKLNQKLLQTIKTIQPSTTTPPTSIQASDLQPGQIISVTTQHGSHYQFYVLKNEGKFIEVVEISGTGKLAGKHLAINANNVIAEGQQIKFAGGGRTSSITFLNIQPASEEQKQVAETILKTYQDLGKINPQDLINHLTETNPSDLRQAAYNYIARQLGLDSLTDTQKQIIDQWLEKKHILEKAEKQSQNNIPLKLSEATNLQQFFSYLFKYTKSEFKLIHENGSIIKLSINEVDDLLHLFKIITNPTQAKTFFIEDPKTKRYIPIDTITEKFSPSPSYSNDQQINNFLTRIWKQTELEKAQNILEQLSKITDTKEAKIIEIPNATIGDGIAYIIQIRPLRRTENSIIVYRGIHRLSINSITNQAANILRDTQKGGTISQDISSIEDKDIVDLVNQLASNPTMKTYLELAKKLKEKGYEDQANIMLTTSLKAIKFSTKKLNRSFEEALLKLHYDSNHGSITGSPYLSATLDINQAIPYSRGGALLIAEIDISKASFFSGEVAVHESIKPNELAIIIPTTSRTKPIRQDDPIVEKIILALEQSGLNTQQQISQDLEKSAEIVWKQILRKKPIYKKLAGNKSREELRKIIIENISYFNKRLDKNAINKLFGDKIELLLNDLYNETPPPPPSPQYTSISLKPSSKPTPLIFTPQGLQWWLEHRVNFQRLFQPMAQYAQQQLQKSLRVFSKIIDRLGDPIEHLNPKLKQQTKDLVTTLREKYGFRLRPNISNADTLIKNIKSDQFQQHFQSLPHEDQITVLRLLRNYSSTIRNISKLTQQEAEEIKEIAQQAQTRKEQQALYEKAVILSRQVDDLVQQALSDSQSNLHKKIKEGKPKQTIITTIKYLLIKSGINDQSLKPFNLTLEQLSSDLYQQHKDQFQQIKNQTPPTSPSPSPPLSSSSQQKPKTNFLQNIANFLKRPLAKIIQLLTVISLIGFAIAQLLPIHASPPPIIPPTTTPIVQTVKQPQWMNQPLTTQTAPTPIVIKTPPSLNQPTPQRQTPTTTSRSSSSSHTTISTKPQAKHLLIQEKQLNQFTNLINAAQTNNYSINQIEKELSQIFPGNHNIGTTAEKIYYLTHDNNNLQCGEYINILATLFKGQSIAKINNISFHLQPLPAIKLNNLPNSITNRSGTQAVWVRDTIPQEIIDGAINIKNVGATVYRRLQTPKDLDITQPGDQVILFQNSNHIFVILDKVTQNSTTYFLVSDANRKLVNGQVIEDHQVRTRWMTRKQIIREFGNGNPANLVLLQSHASYQLTQTSLPTSDNSSSSFLPPFVTTFLQAIATRRKQWVLDIHNRVQQAVQKVQNLRTKLKPPNPKTVLQSFFQQLQTKLHPINLRRQIKKYYSQEYKDYRQEIETLINIIPPSTKPTPSNIVNLAQLLHSNPNYQSIIATYLQSHPTTHEDIHLFNLLQTISQLPQNLQSTINQHLKTLLNQYDAFNLNQIFTLLPQLPQNLQPTIISQITNPNTSINPHYYEYLLQSLPTDKDIPDFIINLLPHLSHYYNLASKRYASETIHILLNHAEDFTQHPKLLQLTIDQLDSFSYPDQLEQFIVETIQQIQKNKLQQDLDQVTTRLPTIKTPQEKANISFDYLAQLSLTEYMAFWKKNLSPFWLGHVTKHGFNTTTPPDMFGRFIRKDRHYDDHFRKLLLSPNLKTAHYLIGLHAIDEPSIRNWLEATNILSAPNEETAKQLLQEKLSNGEIFPYPDKGSIHFSYGIVLEDKYGSEPENNIFFVFPTDIIASKFPFHFKDYRGNFISPSWEPILNDVMFWGSSVTFGIPINAGIVFIPKSTLVDPETGSKYASKPQGNTRVLIENTGLIQELTKWIEQNQNRLPQLSFQEIKQSLEHRLLHLAPSDKKLLFHLAKTIKNLFSPDISAEKLTRKALTQTDLIWKKPSKPITSQEYWEKYFDDHPEQKPSHIVYYDGNPTSATKQFLQQYGIKLNPNEQYDPYLGFKHNLVTYPSSDSRANPDREKIQQIAEQIIEKHYAKPSSPSPRGQIKLGFAAGLSPLSVLGAKLSGINIPIIQPFIQWLSHTALPWLSANLVSPLSVTGQHFTTYFLAPILPDYHHLKPLFQSWFQILHNHILNIFNRKHILSNYSFFSEYIEPYSPSLTEELPKQKSYSELLSTKDDDDFVKAFLTLLGNRKNMVFLDQPIKNRLEKRIAKIIDSPNFFNRSRIEQALLLLFANWNKLSEETRNKIINHYGKPIFLDTIVVPHTFKQPGDGELCGEMENRYLSNHTRYKLTQGIVGKTFGTDAFITNKLAISANGHILLPYFWYYPDPKFLKDLKRRQEAIYYPKGNNNTIDMSDHKIIGVKPLRPSPRTPKDEGSDFKHTPQVLNDFRDQLPIIANSSKTISTTSNLTNFVKVIINFARKTLLTPLLMLRHPITTIETYKLINQILNLYSEFESNQQINDMKYQATELISTLKQEGLNIPHPIYNLLGVKSLLRSLNFTYWFLNLDKQTQTKIISQLKQHIKLSKSRLKKLLITTKFKNELRNLGYNEKDIDFSDPAIDFISEISDENLQNYLMATFAKWNSIVFEHRTEENYEDLINLLITVENSIAQHIKNKSIKELRSQLLTNENFKSFFKLIETDPNQFVNEIQTFSNPQSSPSPHGQINLGFAAGLTPLSVLGIKLSGLNLPLIQPIIQWLSHTAYWLFANTSTLIHTLTQPLISSPFAAILPDYHHLAPLFKGWINYTHNTMYNPAQLKLTSQPTIPKPLIKFFALYFRIHYYPLHHPPIFVPLYTEYHRLKPLFQSWINYTKTLILHHSYKIRQLLTNPSLTAQKIDDLINPNTNCTSGKTSYFFTPVYASANSSTTTCPLWEKTIVKATFYLVNLTTIILLPTPPPPKLIKSIPKSSLVKSCGSLNQPCCHSLSKDQFCSTSKLNPRLINNKCICVANNDLICYQNNTYFVTNESSIFEENCSSSSCVEGRCSAHLNQSCNSLMDKIYIRPRANHPGQYLYCYKNKWQLINHPQQHIYFDNCPNQFIFSYLHAIIKIKDYLLPKVNIFVKCIDWSQPSGGVSNFIGPQSTDAYLHLYCNPLTYPKSCSETITHELAHLYSGYQNYIKFHTSSLNDINNPQQYHLYLMLDNPDFNQFIGCQPTPCPQDQTKTCWLYPKELPVDDDKYQHPIKTNQGFISPTNCSEAFALANNHYVYNSSYMKTYYPLQYEWLKKHIYFNHEFVQSP